MTELNLTEALCKRTITIDNGGEVFLYIWPPKERGDGDYVCDYLAIFPGEHIASCGIGVDGIHAIFVACESLRIIIHNSEQAKKGMLSWWGDDTRYGLPVMSTGAVSI